MFIFVLEHSSLSTVFLRFNIVKDLFDSLPKESITDLGPPQLTGMIIRNTIQLQISLACNSALIWWLYINI